jgi:hypothetical protein
MSYALFTGLGNQYRLPANPNESLMWTNAHGRARKARLAERPRA